MHVSLEPSWEIALKAELAKPYCAELFATVSDAYRGHVPIYPPAPRIFNALSLCPFTLVKVVILGQDPYHGAGQADGLCFSVPDGVRPPPSLKNIRTELESDLGISPRTTGDLTDWARQGVLLLNATLTVRAGAPNSHRGIGWETFTDAIVQKISDEKQHVVFLLWGNYAQKKGSIIDTSKHLVLRAPHPSPFSAHTGFLGCKHFSATNRYLRKHGKTPIAW